MGAPLPKGKQSEGVMKMRTRMRTRKTSSLTTMTMSPPKHRHRYPRSFSPLHPLLLQPTDAASPQNEDKGEAVAEEGGGEGVHMLHLVRLRTPSTRRVAYTLAEAGHLAHAEFFDPNIPGSSAFVLAQPPPPPMAAMTTKKKAGATKGTGAQRAIKKRPSKCALLMLILCVLRTQGVLRAAKSAAAAAAAAAAIQLPIHRDDAESIMSEGGPFSPFLVTPAEGRQAIRPRPRHRFLMMIGPRSPT